MKLQLAALQPVLYARRGLIQAKLDLRLASIVRMENTKIQLLVPTVNYVHLASSHLPMEAVYAHLAKFLNKSFTRKALATTTNTGITTKTGVSVPAAIVSTRKCHMG
jgi:hypothetical protein